ncbi:MAG TPA: chorismate mutase [Bryobacteraceae bacterium]|nr:chorismate mutase [Bryobacteraceae bacterium]
MRPLLLCLVAMIVCAQSDLNTALAPSRQRINDIDNQIVKLLNERASVVREVGLIKKQYHAPADAPGRAEQVLRRVSEQAKAPLTPAAVRHIYQTIVSEMTSMESNEMAR